MDKLSIKITPGGGAEKDMKASPSLGVVRLDYDYPPAPGDIDSAETFGYNVYYRVVPGLTFDMCQAGKLEGDVKSRFIEAIEWLIDEKKVSCIIGDCGFMAYYQKIALTEVQKTAPVVIALSSLLQIPAITPGLSPTDDIMILTANRDNLLNMKELFKDQFGVDLMKPRLHVVGCDHVPGFGAVEDGDKVRVKEVQPGIRMLVKKKLIEFPNTKAIILECTELPAYANVIREESGLPVLDAISCCNFFVQAFQEDQRYGKGGWQQQWDGQQAEDYSYGDNVPEDEKGDLVNQPTQN